MHVSSLAGEDEPDAKVPIYINEDTLIMEFALHFRPFIFDFLNDMKDKFELILYSSLNPTYVSAIVECLERKEKYFVHRFGEDFCIFANLSYGVKCLDFLLGNRNQEDIILVDTTVKCLPHYPDNFVPVPAYSWKNSKDQELPKLASLLDLLYKEQNVTEAISDFR